jgi:hypothetical protein
LSHFTTVVILPKSVTMKSSRDLIEAQVQVALAPFNENTEVDPYDEKCYCVGSAARRASCEGEFSGEALEKLRREFHQIHKDDKDNDESAHLDHQWQKFTAEFFAGREAIERAHPMFEKPDSACDECSGTGTHQSQYNPKSKWDWWSIGGRWTGDFSGYEIEKDKRNYKRCGYCIAGTRLDMDTPVVWESGADPADHPVIGKGCNVCRGTGFELKWTSEFRSPDGDVAIVDCLIDRAEVYVPFAVLTPDGEWAERGEMGWWAIVTNEKDRDEWKESVAAIYEKYRGHVAVLCDLHI